MNVKPAPDFKPSGDGFGPDLARLLAAKGVSILELSDYMHVHHSTIYGWMNGRTLPTVTMLFRLATAIDEPVERLLGFVIPKDWDKDGIAIHGKKKGEEKS